MTARAAQLDLFFAGIVPHDERAPMFKGWLPCDCGLVFWLWPRTGLPPTSCTGTTGAPDLRPFRRWTDWKGVAGMTPEAAR